VNCTCHVMEVSAGRSGSRRAGGGQLRHARQRQPVPSGQLSSPIPRALGGQGARGSIDRRYASRDSTVKVILVTGVAGGICLKVGEHGSIVPARELILSAGDFATRHIETFVAEVRGGTW
jgi:hypothetical protein